MGEIGVRIFVPPSHWQFRDATSDWQADKRLGWIQKPNLDVTTVTEFGWSVRFQTNEDGLMPAGAQRKKEPGKLRIMIFGDSAVVGRSLPYEQTVGAQLEDLLRKRGINAEVINAGVQGYSTDQVYLRMRQLLPLYQPDIVFYAVCDNDFGGNVSRTAYGQPKPMFRLKGDVDLEEIPPDLNSQIHSFDSGPRKWLQYSALYRFFQPTLIALRARFGRWEERNLLGLASEIYYSPQALDHIDWKIFSALIKHMRELAEENHAQFFLYAHPALAEVWDPHIRDTRKKLKLKPGQYDRHALERRLQETASLSGIKFIPLIDFFIQRQSEGPFHLLPRDPHCNAKGYQITAETLEDYLIKNSAFIQ